MQNVTLFAVYQHEEMMEWDAALKVLTEAGYEVEQVDADRWHVRLMGQREGETVVRAAILVALAQSLLRAARH